MKKIISLFTLSILLLGSILLLNTWNTEAAVGNVSMKINTGVSSCLYGTSFYVGAATASFNGSAMTGNFPTVFQCTDFEGAAGWYSMSLQSHTMTGSNNTKTIPATNVYIKVNTQTVTAGTCTTGINAQALSAISPTPWVIIARTAVVGEICTIYESGITLQVIIPASQAVGMYTGTLDLTNPW